VSLHILADRYVIGASLGAGGLAEVFSADDQVTGKPVAIKVLLSQFASVPLVRKRFLQEARLMQSLANEKIVKVFDAGEADGLTYMVMAIAEGGNLAQYLEQRKTPLTARSARFLGLSLARALEAAHAKGVVHQDLKPSNVLLATDPGNYLEQEQILLSDFGQAKTLTMASMTGTSLAWGSPQYMAPEAFVQGRSDPRSDLFSLGVILFEALTLRVPWNTNAPLARVLQKSAAPSVSSGDFELDELIAALLSVEPENRPATAAHVAAILENKAGLSQNHRTIECARCGVRRPYDISLCLSCDENNMLLAKHTGGAWHVILRKLPSDSDAMERLHDLLRTTTGIRDVTLSPQFSTEQNDGAAVGPWSTSIPATLFSGLDEATARSLETQFCAAGLDVVSAKGTARRLLLLLSKSPSFVATSVGVGLLFTQFRLSKLNLLLMAGLAAYSLYKHAKLSRSLFQLREHSQLAPQAQRIVGSLRQLQSLNVSTHVHQLLLQLSAEVFRLSRAWSNAAPAQAWQSLAQLTETITQVTQRIAVIEQSLTGESEGELVRALTLVERKSETAPQDQREFLATTSKKLQTALDQRHALNQRRDALVAQLCMVVSHVAALWETAAEAPSWSLDIIDAHTRSLGNAANALPPSEKNLPTA